MTGIRRKGSRKKESRKQESRKQKAMGAGCVLSAILLFVCSSVPSYGAELSSEYLQGYETAEDSLTVYLDNISVGVLPGVSDFTAVLGGTEVAVTEIEDSYRTPITWYCLVDVSGSIKEDQFAQETDALRAICENLSEGDSMVIGTLGNDLNMTEPLSDRDEIQSVIDGLETGREDTNLYAAIVNSLRTMESMTSLNAKKCLVILSDGEDYQKTGYTREEAYEAVKNSSIPIYTLAALPGRPSEEELGFGKELGSFARMSPGGRDFMPVEDGMEGADVGRSIVEDMRQGLILTLDTSALVEQAGQKDELLLRLSFHGKDGSMREDTCYVYADDLVFSPFETAEETAAITESQPETSEEATDEAEPQGQASGFPVGIAAAAALAVILLLEGFLVVKKKEKDSGGKAEEAAAPGEEGLADDEKRMMDSGEQKESEKSLHDTTSPTEENRQTAVPPVLHRIEFAAIGYEWVHFVVEIEEERIYTLGRNSKSDLILNPEDKKLSSIHCRIRWRNGALDVWDAGSTNGTYYNGVSVQNVGMAVVEHDQTLRMGSYEYRIMLK